MSKPQTTEAKEAPADATQADAPAVESYFSILTPEQRTLVGEYLLSLLEFLRPHEGKTADDVRVFWMGVVMHGESTFLARVKDTRALDSLLTDDKLHTCPFTLESVLRDEMLAPLVGGLQQEAQRRALQILAEKENDPLAV